MHEIGSTCSVKCGLHPQEGVTSEQLLKVGEHVVDRSSKSVDLGINSSLLFFCAVAIGFRLRDLDSDMSSDYVWLVLLLRLVLSVRDTVQIDDKLGSRWNGKRTHSQVVQI